MSETQDNTSGTDAQDSCLETQNNTKLYARPTEHYQTVDDSESETEEELGGGEGI